MSYVEASASDDPLWDVLPDGVVVADGASIVLRTNDVARAMLALSDDGVGRHLRDVMRLQNTDGQNWWDIGDPYEGVETSTGVPEISWLLPGGEEVLATARIIRERRGGPITRVGIVLRSARGRERMDRERSDLVATVAHELRSPLTGVRGFVGTLISKWGVLNDEQRLLMLETVHHDAERLGRLITELLDVARIDTGRLSLYPRPVDLRETVDRVAESCRVGTSRPIEVHVPEDPVPVHADPDKLTQVVTNLVENAVRHGDGPTTVTVDSPGDGYSRLVVDDEGEGIPEDVRRRVFTKFWKHGARGGTGLGMYIVHGLVGAHGGTLEIDSSPAGGARLVLRWPDHDPRETPPSG
ncbi:PAS domain-containing sensor histidine kinase [Marmoricola endophyticus]|uniref:histidine kinase n=1 Tax=Marmoricola endophyticus TaxID=2040280 RepID=A0A917BB68_9ACTN|nr:HAMP domain-containing sensor histidine kinase [Marmoricola endophyticus]GGF35547.1 PAS domain-containing sensor histidine kinase [Marmoricola endophyticus]